MPDPTTPAEPFPGVCPYPSMAGMEEAYRELEDTQERSGEKDAA